MRSDTPGPTSRYLSLPEEFIVLSHLDSGKVHDTTQTAFGCAAAELAELALRRKVLVRPHKSRKFGVEVYRHKGEIELLDRGRTGLAWADELLADLADMTGLETHAVYRWLRRRHRKALPLHRQTLTERGVLHHRPGKLLGKERYYPDPGVRNALINEVRTAYTSQSPLTGHLLLLCDLLDGAELTKDLGLTLTHRQRLDRARGIGAVEPLPEVLRDTSTVLGFSIPKRDGGGFGFGDGD
ncbi:MULTISPECIES: GPP34 family phosphoprotein [Streptomyces]|uniref:GPP34 family phosphoprotein n=1 Tax=Streptomyces dengpaensis TaxID=2049881 RepID=A0ABM6SSM3_9ACTN|nr:MULTISPECIES: GPP34 family phosphoprotein [Streptomyces]AVH57352.1 hypothetical protein C4B68_17970 [Streptomyces dengpaensis]PIB05366.1 hypothetical protein B1C81_29000 [Streptomyces sp. HG99]